MEQYEVFSGAIEDGLEFQLSNVRLALKALSDSITGKASAYKENFPMVNIPDYEMIGQATRFKSGLEMVVFSPIVTKDEYEDYVEFAQKNAGLWLTESRDTALSSSRTTVKATDYANTTLIVNFLWGSPTRSESDFQIVPPGGPHAPAWLLSPPPFQSFVINFDMIADKSINNSYTAMVELKQTVFSPALDLAFLGNSGISNKDHEAYHESLVDWVKDGESAWSHPHALLFEVRNHCQFPMALAQMPLVKIL